MDLYPPAPAGLSQEQHVARLTLKSRFACPDGTDGAPSDECKVAYIDYEVANTAEMLSDAG